MQRTSDTSPALLVGEQWITAKDRSSLPVVDPATEEVFCEVPVATPDDIGAALNAASDGFQVWRATLPIERSRILRGAAKLLRQRVEALAIDMTREQGKPLVESRAEILSAADLFEWFSEETKRVYGRIVASQLRGHDVHVVSEPIGPVAAFTAWNFPAVVPGRKIAGALAAGCSIVIKPAEETPLTVVNIAKALLDAGLPAGVLNILYGTPDQISSALVASPIIRKVAITGSTRVGKLLASQAAALMKPGTYELGGHSAVIVCDDADAVKAADTVAAAKFRNAGQVCTSPNRIFIHDRVYDAFSSRLAANAQRLTVGNGLATGTMMGALTNRRRLDAVTELVDDAKTKGANVLAGGRRLGNQGYFYAPTVLGDVPDGADIMAIEPFGPIAPLQRFNDLDEAVERANATPFGLAGYVFSASAERLKDVTSRLEAGMVGANTCSVAHHEAPFGGVKESGYGREGAIEGLAAYCVLKSITVNS